MTVDMYQIVQANYAQWKPEISESAVNEFISQISGVHEQAELSKGYIWRYVDDPDPKYIDRLFGMNGLVFNMSVWESVEDLKAFTFKNLHNEVMRERAKWFAHLPFTTSIMWWVKQGHIPTAEEAQKKFEQIEAEGPSYEVFTFAKLFYPGGSEGTNIPG